MLSIALLALPKKHVRCVQYCMHSRNATFKCTAKNTLVLFTVPQDVFLFLNSGGILHPTPSPLPSVPVSPLPFFICGFTFLLTFTWQGRSTPFRASSAAAMGVGARAVGGCCRVLQAPGVAEKSNLRPISLKQYVATILIVFISRI